jgi:hypothetical protein
MLYLRTNQGNDYLPQNSRIDLMSREMTEDERQLMDRATNNLDSELVQILKNKKAEPYTYEELIRGIRQLQQKRRKRA